MISLFRKHVCPRLALRPATSAGILACATILTAGASAQVATRTQLSAQQEQGVLTLTAKVGDIGGSGLSEGSVSFETAKGSLGSVFVQDGVATLNLTNPPAWASTVTAVYHGDTAFANSAATTSIQAQATGVPGFTVTASPTSLSLAPGQYGTVNLTVTSQNGFAEAVNLSCSGAPGGSVCNFSPDVVTPAANGTAVSAMQMTTTATSGGFQGGLSNPFGGSRASYAFLLPGALMLVGIGAIRRKNFTILRVIGLVMLLGAGVTGLTSCNQRYGYEHYAPSPNYGTAAGKYTVVISAYSTNGTAITQATSSDASCAGAVCVAMTVQ
jgi:hypothetical protein